MEAKSPLFDYLVKYAEENRIQFHIPGHKSGQAMEENFANFVGENILKIDLINIEPLDDLHAPKAIIKLAQEQTARAYKAKECFYSVQGTSTAIIAMIMAAVGPGEKIIVPRNIHKSILSAVVLSGATPIYVYPTIDEKYSISHGLKLKDIIQAYEDNPGTKAILLINPTYYGYCSDIVGVTKFAHEHNVALLVDEAHGAHLPFSDQLPTSSMEAGADISATSIHKLGGAMTGGSILNYNSNIIEKERVAQILSMLMTTSTSYPIMASIDAATKNLINKGANYWNDCIDKANYLRTELRKIPNLSVAGSELLNGDDIFDCDPTKVLISFKELNLIGHDCEIFLRENYKIEVELSDINNVLLFISPTEKKTTLDLVIKAISEFCQTKPRILKQNENNFSFGKLLMNPREAFYAPKKSIVIEQSIGKICGETIMVYPPGIPIIAIGEEITQENINYIKENVAAALPVKGMSDDTFKTIKVVENDNW